MLLEQKLSTTPKTMKGVFGGISGSWIAVETGMHSPWVGRLLSELGHEVIVAHPRNVRLIGESRRKDDRMDAQTLARLGRIDPQLLCPEKHRSAQAQADLWLLAHPKEPISAKTLGKELDRPSDHVRSALERLGLERILRAVRVSVNFVDHGTTLQTGTPIAEKNG